MLREWQISYGQSLIILAFLIMVVALGGWIIYSSGSGDLPARTKVLENVILETYTKNQELILASASRIEDSARKLETEIQHLEDRARKIERQANIIQSEASADRARIQKILEDRSATLEELIRKLLEGRQVQVPSTPEDHK